MWFYFVQTQYKDQARG